ncbi:hypothetical protein EVAR_48807_1 [Eumeta japonica]|uniref:Uncharacterized protein n=1 Tax=Eumeta variegata TaxID=151549 RepID=A0A4C1Y1R3_EUMVA|nr:hypothetical protein EVAR_48807_1 [Eumeta japonica]
MEVDRMKECKKRAPVTRVLEALESEFDFDTFSDECNDEDLTEVQNRKAPVIFGYYCRLSFDARCRRYAHCHTIGQRDLLHDFLAYRWEDKPQDAPASPKAKASKAANSSQPTKANNAKTPTAVKNLSALLATLKVAYHTCSLKEEREFCVVLRGVPKELAIKEVKEDLLVQDLPVQSMRRIINRARESLDLVLVTANTTFVDNTTKRARCQVPELPRHYSVYSQQRHTCVLCKSSAHTANYLGRSRGSKIKIRKAITENLAYVKSTAGPRYDPVDKINVLVEHASLVEAIKNNKIYSVQIEFPVYSILSCLHYRSTAPSLQSTIIHSIRVGISEMKPCDSIDT